MKSEPLIIEETYNVPEERVWNAITHAGQMKEWYFDLPEFRPEVGFEFQFTGGPDDGKQYLHKCKVTEVSPGEKITYSWRYEGYQGITHVSFEISAQENKTKLKLTHTGLESFPPDNPDFKRENFVEGWTHFVNVALKSFLDKGTAR